MNSTIPPESKTSNAKLVKARTKKSENLWFSAN